jgi:hypothetical protein
MILALILACAAVLSSAAPAPLVDSAGPAPTSLVPLRTSASPTLVIPEPNYTQADKTSRNSPSLHVEPARQDPSPSLRTGLIYSAALITSGVLLAGSGIAYWQHREAADAVVREAGANPLGLMAVATLSIPIGAIVTIWGSGILLEALGIVPRSEVDPDL